MLIYSIWRQRTYNQCSNSHVISYTFFKSSPLGNVAVVTYTWSVYPRHVPAIPFPRGYNCLRGTSHPILIPVYPLFPCRVPSPSFLHSYFLWFRVDNKSVIVHCKRHSICYLFKFSSISHQIGSPPSESRSRVHYCGIIRIGCPVPAGP